MPAFVLERVIAAPAERVFALSLDVGLHVDSMSRHRERVVAGPVSGALGEGDAITWSARHFGIRFRMTSLVHDVDPPVGFSDRQVAGPFAEFRHRHTFSPCSGGTLMRDQIVFRSPFGPLGGIVDALVMQRHLVRLIEARNDELETRAVRGG
ncbi:ligand-binding SRPBCC domain-containing protein [Microbacterium resistens]|uniref:Ligand-binding SRPBCC domain-containing protein n=1 Tax=Microbacterium resistens TaxID=156977 RepID=A0ABU1SD30_9MICO|nr:SRPBCC family protein [Microbacterium resistens]MDR6866812.1 ligand-binding SRPBCC domain-containing protein [Microbacterium resistens]